MKIIDFLRTGEPCFSFEYYPPKAREKWPDFYEKIDRMSRLGPKFIDVTWGTGDPTSLATLEISQNIQNRTQIDTMIHMTCTHRTRQELLDILSHLLRESPIRNVMALRGNRPPTGAWTPHPDGFRCAEELVLSMRKQFGDAFSIAVAGYPEGHREDGYASDPAFSTTPEYFAQIDYLRRKIDAGADFIVTQLCFDLERLCRFRDDCHRHGITVPIVPGILPIHSRTTWEKIATFSASIPPDLAKRYEIASQNDETLESFAARLLEEQIHFLRSAGFPAIHLYTLNHERLVRRVLLGNAG